MMCRDAIYERNLAAASSARLPRSAAMTYRGDDFLSALRHAAKAASNEEISFRTNVGREIEQREWARQYAFRRYPAILDQEMQELPVVEF